jgi:hypothetical protein
MGLSTFLVGILLAIPSLASVGRPFNSTFEESGSEPQPSFIQVEPAFLDTLSKEIQGYANEVEKQFTCHNSPRGQIFFLDKWDAYREFVISTPWLINYPSQLRSHLEAEDFIITTKPAERCDWLPIGSFNSKGIYRVKVAYRHRDHDPQAIGHAGYPHPYSVARIRDVLQGTFPGTELGLILCFSLIPLGILAVWLMWTFRSKWSLRRWRKEEKMVEDDCVELVENPKANNGVGDVVDETDDNKKIDVVSTSTEII